MHRTDEVGPVPPDARPRGAAPPVGRELWHEGADGLRHGPAVRWHPSGALRSRTAYAHGQREGEHRAWFPDGSPEVAGAFEADQPVGRWRRWHATGALALEVTLVDGQLHGPARAAYEDGAPSRIWGHDRGRLDGLDRTFLADGELFSEETWSAGRRVGARRQWMRGRLVLDERWADGARHGPYRAWSWMGRPSAEGAFSRGERVGPWVFHDAAGQPHLRGRFAAGQPVGAWEQARAGGWEPIGLAALPPLPSPDPPPPPPAPAPVGPLLLTTSGVVPTLLVTGFLGAGKTTTIRHLLAHKPADARWVVYVNEAGEVGIDGAAFGATGPGLRVLELAGGCACCTSNLPFVEGVAQAIEQLRPDLLVLEPTGIAEPAALRASLIRALGDQVDLRAVLCLVDPRSLVAPDPAVAPLLDAQIAAADVVVANRWDLAGPAHIAAFSALVDGLPDDVVTLRTTRGRIDPALVARVARSAGAPAHGHAHAHAPEVHPVGAILPSGAPFDRRALDRLLVDLLADPVAFPRGWLRAKGLVQTAEGPFRVEADRAAGGLVLEWTPQAFEGPDRIEVLALDAASPAWSRLAAARPSATS